MKALNILQGWAQEVVQKVAKKSLVEDDLIEFKRTWIKPHKAARRIAAHANAAHGQDILWLIGVDPNEANPFFDLQESKPEEWFGQVKTFFVDGHYPEFKYFHVSHDDKVFYAIVFDTSHFPFLISLKRYNQEEQKPEGVAESELPWREGTSIRSAKRTEILSLLHELPPLPTFEVMAARCVYSKLKPGVAASCQLDLKLYVMPPAGQQPVIPAHRINCMLEGPNGKSLLWKGRFEFKCDRPQNLVSMFVLQGEPVSPFDWSEDLPSALGVHGYSTAESILNDPILVRPNELVIKEPGVLWFRARLRFSLDIVPLDPTTGKLILPVGSEGAVATVRFSVKNTHEK